MDVMISVCRFRYFGWCLLISSVVLPRLSVAQTRPSATTSSGTIACGSCQLSNLDDAWDDDSDSWAKIIVNTPVLGKGAYVVYEFAQPVAQYDDLVLTFSFGGGGGYFSDLITSQVFENLNIQLQTSRGAEITTYQRTNLASAKLVNASDNRFEVRIVNPSADTQRIRIEAGSFTSVLSRDFYIYDIVHYDGIYNFVTTELASGYSESGTMVGLGLCPDCTIENQPYATSTYDPNSEYTGLFAPLTISTERQLLFARYSWGTTTFSGLDYDIYLTLAQESFVSLTTDLFDNDQLAVVLTYTDNTQDTFSVAMNPGLIEAKVLYTGSDKFYLKIDADDAKTVASVEVQLARPTTGSTRSWAPLAVGDSEVRVYNIFAADTETPLPVELLYFRAQAGSSNIRLQWATASEEQNDYFLLERSQDAVSFQPVAQVPGAGQSNQERHYEVVDAPPYPSLLYYQLTQVDFDGNATRFPLISAQASSHTQKVTIVPMPGTNQVQITFHDKTSPAQLAFIRLWNEQGRVIWQEHFVPKSTQTLSVRTDMKGGVYFFSVATSGIRSTQRHFWAK